MILQEQFTHKNKPGGRALAATSPLLRVHRLQTRFYTRGGVVRAVEDLSFAVDAGETLGIVGESGSGKSVAMYSLLGLIPSPPGRVDRGEALFEGRDLLRQPERALRAIRGKEISMIFQDPMTALNPYLRVGVQVMEPLRIHEGMRAGEARGRAADALASVGIQDARRRMAMYPHEFSGGMRQRVMIAMALITRPRLLIADEPTTALDVTVQAQILALIKKQQAELGMAVLLITHDMGVIAEACDRVLVMYAGLVMESGPARGIFRKPLHPYTRALMRSRPALHGSGGELYAIPGLPPDLITPMTGCPFAPRCEHARDLCREAAGELREFEAGHHTACVRVIAGEL